MILEEDREFLEHYGVKGMKWGVVNDETGQSDKGSVKDRFVERNTRINTDKRNMLTARAHKADIRISELMAERDALPKTAVAKRASLNYNKEVTKKQRDEDLKRAKNINVDGLTSTQKKLLIGGAVAAVVIGASIATSKGFNKEAIPAMLRRKESMAMYGDIFKPHPEFAGPLSLDQVKGTVLQGINPMYDTQGGSMNCRRNTFAYELRRRGYDVCATTSPMGFGQSESGLTNALIRGDKNVFMPQSMSNFASDHTELLTGIRTNPARFDKRTYSAFTETIKDEGFLPQVSDKLTQALGKHGSGARGEVVFDMGGFAHSMQWEVFDGVPHIFDAQKAAHYPVTKEGMDTLMGKWGRPFRMDITRLDDVDLDMEFLSRWVQNTIPSPAKVSPSEMNVITNTVGSELAGKMTLGDGTVKKVFMDGTRKVLAPNG